MEPVGRIFINTSQIEPGLRHGGLGVVVEDRVELLGMPKVHGHEGEVAVDRLLLEFAVYWEAGLAEGLGRKVFFTGKKNEPVRFDTGQSYIIFWEPDKLPEAAE